MCLSAMMQLELPHLNVLTKMDMVRRRDEEYTRTEERLERYIIIIITTIIQIVSLYNSSVDTREHA
jgi:hypothetical protein